MHRRLKMGVIGAGNIFREAHIHSLSTHPELEMAAVCDNNEETAERAAKDYNIPTVYADYKELLSREDIDVINICTPNLFHSIIAIDALQAGKHVLCEKPDAITPAEAQKMADAARASGKILMVMRNNRFTPASRYLKQYIEEGNMGELYTGRCGWIRRRGIPGKGGWFTTKALSGGGPLIDLGVHFIDLAVWLMGNPKPVAVSGATYAKFGDSVQGKYDVEDLATGFIRFESGATLQIEFSWASNIGEEMNFIELRGTKAGFSLKRNELQIFSETAGQLMNSTPVFKHKDSVSPHHEQLNHFIDCVQQRAEPIIRPEQGVDMVKIISAIYESAELGKEVRL